MTESNRIEYKLEGQENRNIIRITARERIDRTIPHKPNSRLQNIASPKKAGRYSQI